MSNLFNGRVFVGNFTDSRCGSHSYAFWTVTQDYRIVVDGEADVFLHRSNFDHDVISEITPVEGVDSEISWEKVFPNVREYYFGVRFPEGTEIEKNIFVYGEQLGSKKNEEMQWLDDHCVYNRDVTRLLRDRFGDFEAVEAPQYTGVNKDAVAFVLNGSQIVNVWQVYIAQPYCGGSHYGWSYSVQPLAEIKEAQKAFGLSARALAHFCGVPWDIAKMGAEVPDWDSAMKAIDSVCEARGLADKDLRWELTCGIGRRKSAIAALIGDEAYETLRVDDFGQNRSRILASYLLAE